ncbi:MAG TPA: hypothetical protein VGL81_22925 [Polyangiaceae bacterium]|jgi:hypothetical protein
MTITFAEETIPRRSGPLDDVAWPDKITAHVVAPGHRPRVHGYDVEGDLARHYSFTDTVLLALTGELPSEAQSSAFEVAMQFLSPSPVNEAPAHAAVIVRICNVLTSAIVGTAAITLGEQARATVEGEQATRPVSPEERASVERLRDVLRSRGVLVPTIEYDLGRTAALIATLRFAGLERAEQIEAAIVLARLPAAVSEAFATPTHSYRDYPADLPAVRYMEPS